jgi:hypothetical protein
MIMIDQPEPPECLLGLVRLLIMMMITRRPLKASFKSDSEPPGPAMILAALSLRPWPGSG